MRCGILKWFDVRKGVGFIVPLEAGPDVFLHASILEDRPFLRRHMLPGTRIHFEAKRTNNGFRATRIELEATFITLTLPSSCSHKFAAMCENTGETDAFHTRLELEDWCARVKERLLANG